MLAAVMKLSEKTGQGSDLGYEDFAILQLISPYRILEKSISSSHRPEAQDECCGTDDVFDERQAFCNMKRG